MIVFVYDGSFEGLLTAIYQAYYQKNRPERIIRAIDYRQDLLSTVVTIETNNDEAAKVYQAIEDKISPKALKQTYLVFLAEDKDGGTLIYRYLQLAFKLGPKVDDHILNPQVGAVHKLSQKVAKEKHRMLGLVRFQLINHIYYAPIEPDYNVISLIAPHFAQRMADQDFIIHDARRGIGACYNRQEWVIVTDFTVQDLHQLDYEGYYEDLWQRYFKSIAIKERLNPRLQQKNMPKRYWKHLTELE